MSIENHRANKLATWISRVLKTTPPHLQAVSGDASFRRYFRLTLANLSYIAVDAPPEKESCEIFVKITQLLASHQVKVPHVFHYNLQDGFMLLEDFGDCLLLNELDISTANSHYANAMQLLQRLQAVPNSTLPLYDEELLAQELNLFTQWYINTHLMIDLTQAQQKILQRAYQLLIESALQQPKVFVHRDFHSRNLMLLDNTTIGTIDYQDAVRGPLTYDLVSLLRDCYISWPDEQVYAWANHFYKEQQQTDVTEAQFVRWFDLMGMQRHLKAVGIFSRLHHRDQKSCYLNDIPRTLEYIVHISRKYPELEDFHQLVSQQLAKPT